MILLDRRRYGRENYFNIFYFWMVIREIFGIDEMENAGDIFWLDILMVEDTIKNSLKIDYLSLKKR